MSKIILNGSRISSRKLSQTGFEFKYEKLNNALKNLR
jgi:NAD dependent epimerase/dehydratase family enzyme